MIRRAAAREGTHMKIRRRKFLNLAMAAVALPAVPRMARALDYPTRPVRVIVGFAAGGPGDIVVRMINQWLSIRLGQQFILENRPGAGTNVGTEAVVRSEPDGYTLLLVTSAAAINASMYEKLGFNFIRDIVPVASLDRVPLVMEVNPSLPVKTVGEFIAYAKANPGKVNFASGGIGTVQHVAGELFKFMTGVDLVHVPYRGAALALTDLLAGQVQVTFSPVSASMGYIRAGTLRALAVTSAARVAALPDVPTVSESVPGYEAIATDGIGAPKDTPADIVARLNQEINAGLADPAIKARFADLGGVPAPLSSAEFGKFMAAETEKWAKVIKFANIKAE
jgi:tripartite-type tricarboxylate transporter receptor subunit TctC